MAKIRGITVGKGNWEGPQSKHPDKSLYQGYWPLIEINKMAYEEIIPAIRNNSLVGIEFPASAATYDEYGMLAGRPLGHLALVNIIDDINRTNEDPEKLAARVNMFCLSPGLSLLYLANQFRKQGAPSEVIDTHRFFQRKRARELFEQGSVEGIQPYIVDMVLKDSKVNPMKYQEFNKIYGDYIDSMLGYLLSLDRETYTKSPKLHNLRGMRTISEQKRVLSRELVTSLAGSYVMWHFAIHDLGLSWEDTFHGLVDPPPEKFLGTNRLPASYVKSMMYPTDGYPEEYIPPHKLVDDMVIQHSSRKVKKNSGRWQ